MRGDWILAAWLALAGIVGVSCLAGEPKETKVTDVGSKKQLLFDEALIASKTGFTTTVNQATRIGQVIAADKPWEKIRFSDGPSVVKEGPLFKMWYHCMDETKTWFVCYATSEDGLQWKKPNLGIIDYKGSKDNNIVFAGTPERICVGSVSVFVDQNEGGAKKYKMIFGSYPRDRKPVSGLPDVLVYDYSEARWKPTQFWITAAYSEDGLHWTPGAKPRIVDWYTDTREVAFWDRRIGKYVLFVRWNHLTWDRSIGRSESADFENFPKPQLVLTPDALDSEVTGLYNSAAMQYLSADRAYFLFPSAFYHTRGSAVAGLPDASEVQLATSRDGVRFQRPSRKAFLGVGPEGEFDARQVYLGKDLIAKGDELLMYYTGYRVNHQEMEKPPLGNGGFGAAKIRMDGFVSQDSPATAGAQVVGGTLTTVPLKFSGNKLELNLNAGAGGWLKVEILGPDGEPLPGFSAKEADYVLGNSLRKTVTWKGKGNVSELQGKTIQLRFLGRDVKLYAFNFLPHDSHMLLDVF